jgi:CTP synthase
VAVIEYARNVLHWEDANSTEFEPTCSVPAIIFMPEGSKTHMGGTMRLGSRPTLLQATDCHVARLYQPEDNIINERHRHRCVPLHRNPFPH